MTKIKQFLSQNSVIIIFWLLTNSIFYLIFKLAYLEINLFYLGFQISLILLLIILVIKILFFVNNENYKQKIKKLEIENQKLNDQLYEISKKNYDYFLLWLHQIKTPISATKLLLDQQPLSQIALKKQIVYIENYTQLALNYFRLKNINQSLTIDYVDLDAVITNVLKKISILFIDNNNLLKYEKCNQKVMSDYKWLAIIIEQLLNNAAKYTHDGEISIHYLLEQHKLVISDTGIGIDNADLPKIFNSGYSGIANQSSGIGLYIVKQVADMLQIKIVIDSVINQGTTVSLVFPTDDSLHNC